MSSIIVLSSSDEDEATPEKRPRLDKSQATNATTTAKAVTKRQKNAATPKLPKLPPVATIRSASVSMANAGPKATQPPTGNKALNTAAVITPIISGVTSLNSSNTPIAMDTLKSCPIPGGITVTRFNSASSAGTKVYPAAATIVSSASSLAVANLPTQQYLMATNSAASRIVTSKVATTTIPAIGKVNSGASKLSLGKQTQPKEIQIQMLPHQLTPTITSKTFTLQPQPAINQKMNTNSNTSTANTQNVKIQIVHQTTTNEGAKVTTSAPVTIRGLKRNANSPNAVPVTVSLSKNLMTGGQIRALPSSMGTMKPLVKFHPVKVISATNNISHKAISTVTSTTTTATTTATIMSAGNNTHVMRGVVHQPASVVTPTKTPQLVALQNFRPQLSGTTAASIRQQVTALQVTPPADPPPADALSTEKSVIQALPSPVRQNNNTSPIIPMLPMITSVQSMAPSATPPLKLLATPPHTSGSLAESGELLGNLLMSPPPKSVASNQLPTSGSQASTTTITVQSATSTTAVMLTDTTTTTTSSTTPTVIQMPTISSATKATVTPQRDLSYSPSTSSGSPQQQQSLAADDSQQSDGKRASIITIPPSEASPPSVQQKRRRVQPTALLKNTDAAWLEKQQQRAQTNNNNNITNNSGHNSNKFNLDDDVVVVSTTTILSPKTSPVVNCSKVPEITTIDLDGPSVSAVKGNNNNNIETASIAVAKETRFKAEPPPLTAEYEDLVRVCREADGSEDMTKVIKLKLLKYYNNAHPEYLRSRSFRKNVLLTIENIKRQSDLVYLHLNPLVHELKVRRRSKHVEMEVVDVEESSSGPDRKVSQSSNCDGEGGEAKSSEPVPGQDPAEPGGGSSSTGAKDVEPPSASTGNKHTDHQIRKLNRTLHILKKHIDRLEESEVDWDDEDSSYLRLERLKKRACLIYNKICDLTGENRNAHRLDKKPIKFNGTSYGQFNKTLQAYINRTKAFPDFCDVLRMFEHCNDTYEYNLAPFQCKRVAQEAFIEVGKLLQARRKTDLYEMVTHFTANATDPAQEDPDLQAKLSENRKNQTKINDVLEKYAREQDMNADELRLARLNKASSSSSPKDVNSSETASSPKPVEEEGEKAANPSTEIINLAGDGDEDDSSEDEEEDEDDGRDGLDLESDGEHMIVGSDSESDCSESLLPGGKRKTVDDKARETRDSTVSQVGQPPPIENNNQEKPVGEQNSSSGHHTNNSNTATEIVEI